MIEEIKACWISPEQREVDVLLEEKTEREEMAEEEQFQPGKKIGKSSREGEIERLSQTKKRKSEENSDDPPQKSRRTSSEAISLREQRTRNGFQTKGTQTEEQVLGRRKRK